MNNTNYDELRNTLELIQNICINTESCETCPFGNDNGECLITENAPYDWRFIDPIPVVRVLK